MLENAGMRTEFVWGAHETWLRSKILDRLTHDKLDVVVCSSVFQQAIDVPELRAIVNGAGGASVIATLQRLGRGTRRAEGKDSFELWDIVDRGNRWLERHSRERIRAYEGEGYTVETVPEFSAPNEKGELPDPDKVNAEAEYRKGQKEVQAALKALTGEKTIRRR
jgi:superfamily II DNA or RNA helicase